MDSYWFGRFLEVLPTYQPCAVFDPSANTYLYTANWQYIGAIVLLGLSIYCLFHLIGIVLKGIFK